MTDGRPTTDANDASPERKRARKAPAAGASNAPTHALSMDLFRRRGFVVVPSFLTSDELVLLRGESTQLLAALSADAAVATQKLVDNGCVLDTMADAPMEETATARVEKCAYLAARARQVERVTNDLISLGTSSTTLERLLFERLPSLVTGLLGLQADEDVFFFNEHYVVKPPQSNVEFRWHRDDDEQLAMCVHRDEIPPYVSAWCALDDVTDDNGPLQFVALDVAQHLTEQSADEFHKLASEPVLVRAGTAVLFLSHVWHFSASNSSSSLRRAFYTQYSRQRITAAPRDDAPLSFAIPCSSGARAEPETKALHAAA